jgi:hypothetical protein
MALSTRRHRPGLLRAVRVSLALLALAVASPAVAQEYLDPGHPLHARLMDDIAQGRVTRADALMTAVRAVFAPAELQTGYAPLATEPLRCATPLVRAVDNPASGLDPSQLQTIRAWRDRVAARRLVESAISSGGRFRIEFETSGTDSVDITDEFPANGIPDFVDRIGDALEESWTYQVDSLGFDPPETDGMPFEVGLLAIGSFGYTELDATAPGGTRIVMRNNYEGLPPNEDPDGSALGSLRVTAAHEFRHAGQYATSGWSEPGLWIEIDAIWSEDQVFDDVNDYWRYLENSSPISAPALPLDNGGTPSYGESVLQFWLELRAGVDGVREYWERRRNFPGEHPLDSYESVLMANYAPLDSAFVDFALHNLQCGSLAAPGIGYPEAAGYPDTQFAEVFATLPAAVGSTVEHLAAKLYRFDGFSDTDDDILVRLRQPEGLNLQVAALVVRQDGTRVEEALRMTALDQEFRLTSPARDVATLFLVVANGNKAGEGELFFADVEEVTPLVPVPVATLQSYYDTLTLAVGQTRDLSIDFANEGSPSSTLEFTARATNPTPAASRGIEMSRLSLDQLAYQPGKSIEYALAVLNNGTGFGFIAGVSLALPPGVTMAGGQDIVSESGSALTFVGVNGQTGEVQWLDLDGGFGAIASGQSGIGKVTLNFALNMSGPALLDWQLDADGFGGGEQQVTGQAMLAGPTDPIVALICPTPIPPAIVGEVVAVTWLAADPGPVTVELSRDDGENWETLADATENDGYFPWVADQPVTDLARLRVRSGAVTSAASGSFPILQTLPWATMVPESGSLAGSEGLGLRLRVDASLLAPGTYPVSVDVRDANTEAKASIDLWVDVVASAVDAPQSWRTRVIGVYPNPFNPSTELRFELAARQWVLAEVLDLRGRRVRTLHTAPLEAGPHALHWDGTDEAGSPVGSGTYLWRVRTPDKQFTGKMSLVR